MTSAETVILSECIRDVIRARAAVKTAEQLLMRQLPKKVQDEIHYNHTHAHVPEEYEEAKKVLLGMDR